MRYLVWAFILIVLAAAVSVAVGWRPPYRYNPWVAIDLRAEPDWLTRFRLYRLGRAPDQCMAALSRSGAVFKSVPNRQSSDGCGWQDGVMLLSTGAASLARPTLVTCPLAASLVMFDLHVLQPDARAAFGSSITTIEHVGSYNCRAVKGDGDGGLSSHAKARAIDVTGFRLENGRDITLAQDWRRPQAGPFLHETQAEACRYFGIVLGPEYNAAHAGHFHMQAGSAGWCR